MRRVALVLALLALVGVGIAILFSREDAPEDGGTVERSDDAAEQGPPIRSPVLAGRELPAPPTLVVRLSFDSLMKHRHHSVHLQGVSGGKGLSVVLAPGRDGEVVQSVASSWGSEVEVERVEGAAFDVRISPLPPGTYTVRARGFGGGIAGSFSSGVHVVEVGDGETKVALELTRTPPTGLLSAQLLRDGVTDDRAVFRVMVEDLTVQDFRADRKGSPTPHEVPASVTLTVLVHEYQGSSVLGAVPAQSVVVREGETLHLTFEAPKATPVLLRAVAPSGEVVPCSLSLWRVGADRQPVPVNVTNALRVSAGVWSGPLPAGRYRASAGPHADLSRGWTAFEVTARDEEQIIEVPVGDDPRTVAVRIRLLSPDGTTPASEQRYNLNRRADRLETLDVEGGRTDAEGWIRTRPLVPGTYDLILWSSLGGEPAKHLARRIEIARHRDEIELTLPEGALGTMGHLRGTVTDPTGVGASQVVVNVRKEGEPWFYVVHTTHAGTLHLAPLEFGTWIVTVRTSWMREPTWGEASTIVTIDRRHHEGRFELEIPRR